MKSFNWCRLYVSILFVAVGLPCAAMGQTDDSFTQTRAAAQRFEQTASSISKVLIGDLKYADSATLLIPDHFFAEERDRYGRTNKHRYSPHNSGADHYPHLVITASILDPALYDGRMKEMLRNEVRFTNVKDGIPGNYDFKTRTLGKLSLFGGAEYMKDGVIPITEMLGRTPWYDRMLQMAAGVMNNSTTKSRFGHLPGNDSEINGDMLQVFSRLIPMTADPQMLEWGRRIADAYIDEAIPGTFGLVPTRWDFVKHTGNRKLRLRDHGNETLVGLVLMAAIEQNLKSDRADRYLATVRNMLNRMLQSANADGLLYNVINAEDLLPENQEIADNWGYVYGAVYSLYMMTGDPKYREACLKVLNNISKYKNFQWEGEHYDGIADSVESALYLLARESVPSAFDFVESEIARMQAMQKPDGHLDKSYLEGNFNRTSIMYMMYKSQGVLPVGWRRGVGIGAQVSGEDLNFSIVTKGGDQGEVRVRFDTKRHQRILNFPKNYPRVNEFPEWFVVDANQLYQLSSVGKKDTLVRLGSELSDGVDLRPGDWTLRKLS